MAQLDIDQALMDSPSADLMCLLGIFTPLGLDVLFFVYILVEALSSKLVRAGLKVLPLQLSI